MLPTDEFRSKRQYDEDVTDIFAEVVRMITSHNLLGYVVCIYDQSMAGGENSTKISIWEHPLSTAQDEEPAEPQEPGDDLKIWLCVNKKRPRLRIKIIGMGAVSKVEHLYKEVLRELYPVGARINHQLTNSATAAILHSAAATESDLQLHDQRKRAMLKRKYHESKVTGMFGVSELPAPVMSKYRELEAGIEAHLPPPKRSFLGFSTGSLTSLENYTKTAAPFTVSHIPSMNEMMTSIKDYFRK